MTDHHRIAGAITTSAGSNRVFTSGYDHCTSRTLDGLAGVLLTRITSGRDERQAKIKQNPDDAFGVAITFNAHDCDVRYGRTAIRSGRLPQGCVTFSDPGQRIHAETSGAWDTFFVHLPYGLIERVCDAAEIPNASTELGFINPGAAKDVGMLDIARRAYAEVHAPGPFGPLRAEMIAQDFLILMLSRHSTASQALSLASVKTTRGGLAPWQLRRAFDVMDMLPEGQITLDLLAKAVGCSATHFSRAFKQSTGIAPFPWLLTRRIERAKALLRDIDTRLVDVALAVGFAAQPQFTAAFKRVTGQTTGAWRRDRMD